MTKHTCLPESIKDESSRKMNNNKTHIMSIKSLCTFKSPHLRQNSSVWTEEEKKRENVCSRKKRKALLNQYKKIHRGSTISAVDIEEEKSIQGSENVW